MKTLRLISSYLDCCGEYTGKAVSWLVLALVVLVSYDVTMRYLFSSGSIALQEMEWHLYAVIFLVGAAYTFKHDDHVRLDLFYQSRFMTDYRRAWVNLLGGIFMLIPIVFSSSTVPGLFVSLSYLSMEGSPDPGGLAYRWILKAVIPAGFILLLLQGLADIARNLERVLEKDS